MLVGLKCNQELLQQLIAVQAVMRSPTKSDVLRHLIQDAYEKFFADKVAIASNDSHSNLPSPAEVSEALRMHNGHPWLPPGCSMSDRIMRCWDRLSAEQRDCYRSMCGWSEEDAAAALDFAKQTY